jgi:hypothetical protein
MKGLYTFLFILPKCLLPVYSAGWEYFDFCESWAQYMTNRIRSCTKGNQRELPYTLVVPYLMLRSSLKVPYSYAEIRFSLSVPHEIGGRAIVLRYLRADIGKEEA